MAECGLCGTAAVISPVGKIVDHGKEICMPSGMTQMGPVTQKLYDTLTGIQMGRVEAPEGWIVEILVGEDGAIKEIMPTLIPFYAAKENDWKNWRNASSLIFPTKSRPISIPSI